MNDKNDELYENHKRLSWHLFQLRVKEANRERDQLGVKIFIKDIEIKLVKE